MTGKDKSKKRVKGKSGKRSKSTEMAVRYMQQGHMADHGEIALPLVFELEQRDMPQEQELAILTDV